jgi:alkylation response protein AidB-like acyl-CoA dehydrogenase
VGIAQGALDYALGYVKERKQFGKALAEFQGLQFMIADMGMKLEAARQLTYAAAAKSQRGDADLPFFGAAAKCFASDVAWRSPPMPYSCSVVMAIPRTFPLSG